MSPIETGTAIAGRYRLEAELGRGGMGVVYRAHDALLDRPVALKILSAAELGTEGKNRLLREAQAAARLNHPNIVSIYDAGEAGGLPYIVMELVEGRSLRDVGGAALPLSAALALARQVLAALEHAHASGIIHRDLKPENIVITRRSQTAKLMDFGLALTAGAPRLTTDGAIVGTFSYLAPELIGGHVATPQSDLYAFGVLLYELVAGRPPFTGETLMAVLGQHLHAPVVPPSTYNTAIPPALDELLLRLLAKQPGDRPASAATVREALERLDSADAPAPASDSSLLDRIVRGRLVGRQAELRQLREHWSQSQSGQGHLVLISGEPGVGKTRTAGELIVYAQLHGAAVLRGGCYEYEAATPYLPFVEALRAWVHAQDTPSLRAVLGPAAAEIARLAPEIETRLGPLPPSPALPPHEERLRLFDELARCFQRLAAARGLLLFLDDLHWADHGTLALLQYLLRQLRGERLLVVAAYREIELDRTHPLAAALVDWNRERLATRVALGRLSLADTAALIATLFAAESITDDFAQAIYRETEGNPFFVEEVCKALVEQGGIYRAGDRWERKAIGDLAIPQSIKEAIGRRLDRLTPACGEILHTAAALGKVFAFAELAAVAGVSEDALLDALDEAGAAQLLRAERGEQFAFTHDKIREVLYEELNPIRRRRLHQRIGEGLERLYAAVPDSHVQDLAHHFGESGDLERELHYARRAADHSARVYAHAETLAYLERARECAEALGRPADRAEIHAALAGIHNLVGDYEVAVSHYQRALALETAPARQASIKAAIGAILTHVGDARGVEYLQAALAEIDPETQPDEWTHATALLGRSYHNRGDMREAIRLFEAARAVAEARDSWPLGDIYAYLAGSYQHLSEVEQSMAWARAAVALGERRDDPHSTALGYEFLAEDSTLINAWRDTIAYADRDREIGQRIGARDRVAWAEYSRARGFWEGGNLPAALAAAQASQALAEQSGDLRLMVLATSIAGRLLTDLGDFPAAEDAARLALARAEDLGTRHMLRTALVDAAGLHLARHDWDRAEALVDRLAALLAAPDRAPLPQFGHVLVHLARGRIAEARAAADSLLDRAPRWTAPAARATVWRLHGQIATAEERYPEAAAAFQQALDLLQPVDMPVETARVLARRAELNLACGRLAAAGEDARQAEALFAAAGALPERDEAAALVEQLSALGSVQAA